MHSHITIPVDNQVLTGDLFMSERPSAAMVICHGWTSKNQKYLPLAETLASKGISTFAMNLRGHGDSTYSIEQYARKDHLLDFVATIDYMKALVKDVPLFVLGKSYGGYLASFASTKRQIDFLILSQPALYPDRDFDYPNAELIRKNPDIFRSKNEKVDSNSALSAIRNFTRPIFIITSEHDEEVFDTPLTYVSAAQHNPQFSTYMLKGSDHPLTQQAWKDDFYSQVVTWAQKQLVSII
jgi:esterase/lipase